MYIFRFSKYKTRIRAAITSQGLAYGFTLTVWGTGTLAPIYYGSYTLVRALLFVAGPLLMYAVLTLILYGPDEATIDVRQIRPAAFAFLDFLSVPAGVGAAILVFNLVPLPLVGIFSGAFLSTLVYNIMLAVQLMLFIAREPDNKSHQEGI